MTTVFIIRFVDDLAIDNDGKFKYFFLQFWCFNCRTIILSSSISVDRTFLKGKFEGTILLVAALDSDNHNFTLGFGIADSKNAAAWLWFFENLKKEIGEQVDLVIISDRNPNIPNDIAKVYLDANHGICRQHLTMNWSTKFKIHLSSCSSRIVLGRIL